MKILYHHRTLGDGAEGIHVSSIVSAFRELGHQTRLTAMIGESSNKDNLRVRSLQLFKNAIPGAVFEGLELGYSLYGKRVLQKHIDEWNPDILYERYTLFNYAGVLAAQKNNIPLILEVNAPLALERAQYEKLTWKRAAKKSEAAICNRADRIVVVSTPLKEYLVAQGVSAKKIKVIPNGANPDRFKPDDAAKKDIRKKLGIAEAALVVGFTGILRPWHGVHLFLEAFAAMHSEQKNVTALIVGDGPSYKELKELAAALGISNQVCFTGRVEHDEIPGLLAACEIAVSPRATFYASPMKISEYMSTGLAVIAPRMPNIEDLINDGVDGLLFEAENQDSLKSRILELITDEKKRLSIANAARERILSKGSWQHIAEQTLSFSS